MSLVNLNLARVSNGLRTHLAQRQMTRTQSALLDVQNQLTTGKRITTPSDDPGAAAISQQLRKAMEQRQAYADNLAAANSHLSNVDSTLGDATDLLQQAQTIASANVGSDVTADQRSAASVVVSTLYNQMLTLANRQFNGSYIFAGDRATQTPFAEALGGIQFNGSTQVLGNQFDDGTVLPFMVDGNQVFGALSSRVTGTVDLTPRVTAQTRLADLRGTGGQGVQLGSIRLSNGPTTKVVDLSKADTIGGVISAINGAGVGGITASINVAGDGLTLTAGAGDDITVSDTGSSTAADLGIAKATGGGAGVSVDGGPVQPRVTGLTRLADLKGGAGIDLTKGLLIKNGVKSVAVDLTGAQTVEDLLNRINSAGVGALAKVNDAGTGVDVLNSIQGLSMSVAENGGTTAGDLGIRSYSPETRLADLNGGKGVRTTPGGADFTITRRNGSPLQVDISNAVTVQDVIDAINTADAGNGLTASFAAIGNGIVLTDSTGGFGPIKVSSANSSIAATDLGLLGQTSNNTRVGSDVAGVTADGVFANFAKLRNALEHNDQTALTDAATGLKADLDRVVRLRGQTGARVQEIESRQQRLDDENVATQGMLSNIEDVNYDEAVTRFQTLQTALQASYQTTGKLLNLSLLDFLG